jgi:hypothetical protein
MEVKPKPLCDNCGDSNDCPNCGGCGEQRGGYQCEWCEGSGMCHVCTPQVEWADEYEDFTEMSE